MCFDKLWELNEVTPTDGNVYNKLFRSSYTYLRLYRVYY